MCQILKSPIQKEFPHYCRYYHPKKISCNLYNMLVGTLSTKHCVSSISRISRFDYVGQTKKVQVKENINQLYLTNQNCKTKQLIKLSYYLIVEEHYKYSEY